ncbi:MAG TPA: hypothetical protein HA252_00685 [Candidatus Diapherotrites archaeon]|uniref:Uncharacterized protein n=1 Tax=Candidatus Iainarchaeum sp. TaxID=3101447 RepID=A0A7J4JHN1_9ARCH|nr:hypothetical protein [Candidatus Diapherotrites archaeon]HIH15905.1 hypothetical protein [Candidatus Diapherotrites archaeon]
MKFHEKVLAALFGLEFMVYHAIALSALFTGSTGSERFLRLLPQLAVFWLVLVWALFARPTGTPQTTPRAPMRCEGMSINRSPYP